MHTLVCSPREAGGQKAHFISSRLEGFEVAGAETSVSCPSQAGRGVVLVRRHWSVGEQPGDPQLSLGLFAGALWYLSSGCDLSFMLEIPLDWFLEDLTIDSVPSL